MIRFVNIVSLLLLVASCSARNSADNQTAAESVEAVETTQPSLPDFNADSAYRYVADQVAFGPRVPGTEAHRRCRDYIVERMNRFGADSVWMQTGEVTAFDGKKLPLYNIMARFNASAPRRILIAAHYDTRPWADQDADEANHKTPIDGANDGASGVGVAMELARNIGAVNPQIGVDFLFTDVEDYGRSSDAEDADGDDDDTWAIGSRYWAESNPYEPRERPVYGILLDMVGGRDATFYREYFSETKAGWVNAKVWSAAKAEGVDRFVDDIHGAINDDHINIMRAGIPTIDIIECGNPSTGGFPPHWHTLDDNIKAIDPATLRDVGATMMRLIYSEPR